MWLGAGQLGFSSW